MCGTPHNTLVRLDTTHGSTHMHDVYTPTFGMHEEKEKEKERKEKERERNTERETEICTRVHKYARDSFF